MNPSTRFLHTVLGVLALGSTAGAQLPASPQATVPLGPIGSSFDTAYLLAVGDVDGDGHDDVVTASVYGLEIRLSNPGGTLRPPAAVSFFGMPIIGVGLADVDNDGRDELVVQRASTAMVGGGIDVKRIVAGPGALLSLVHLATVSAPYFAGPERISCVDVDGDGLRDLVVPEGRFGTVSVFANTGNAAAPFADPATVVLNVADPRRALATDLNADGRVDLVVTYATSTQSGLAIFEATAPAVFAAPVHLGGPAVPHAVADGTIDGDVFPDLAVATDVGTFVLMNATTGVGAPIALAPAVAIDPSATDPECAVALVDVDADGDVDAVVGPVAAPAPSGGVAVATSQSAQFTPPTYSTTTGPALQAAAGDLDGDGDLDVVALADDLGASLRVLDLLAGKVVPPSPSYPGTGDALALTSAVLPDLPVPAGGPLNDVKPAGPGDTIVIRVDDQSGLFAPALVYVDGVVTGAPVAAGPPGVWTTSFPRFVTAGHPPLMLSGTVPGAPPLLGLSVLVQAFSPSPAAANGSYAATDAHEIQLF